MIYGIAIGCILLPLSPLVATAQNVTLRASGGPAGTGKDIAIQFPAEAVRKANPGWIVDVINGPTSIAEIDMMARGDIDFSRVGADEIYNIRKGYYFDRKMPKPVELRWLAPSVVQSFALTVLESAPIDSIYDLKKKKYPLKFSTGRKGTGPYLNAMSVLEAYGITPEEIESWGGKIQYQASRRSMELMADGILEAYMSVATIPETAFAELSRTRKLKIIFASEPEIQTKLKASSYVQVKIPASAYSFMKGDAFTMGMPSVIVCTAAMKDEIAYRMTKGIWEQRPFLNNAHPMFKEYLQPEIITAWGTQFKDILHPGAAKYYREQGLLKQ